MTTLAAVTSYDKPQQALARTEIPATQVTKLSQPENMEKILYDILCPTIDNNFYGI